MRILVTGASGRIGKHVIQELERSHELKLFSRQHPREGRGKFETSLPHLSGDLRDREALKKAVDGMDAVAHLGANPWISDETFAINALGTYYLLEACKEAGIRRFVMAGSDWGVDKHPGRPSVPRYVPVDEHYACRPHDNYGLSKVVGETVVEMYAREYGFQAAVFRITGVWMPEKTREYAKADKSGAAEGGAPYWWTYVDVRDVAAAFRQALEKKDLPAYGHYFIAAADTTIEEPTMEVVKKHWPKVEVRKSIPGRGSVLDFSNAREAFGYNPARSWKNPG